MKAALLLSSPHEADLELALAWAEAGDDAHVVLLDAAAAIARAGHAKSAVLRRLVAAGVAVAAHDDALRRRGIDAAALADGVKMADMGEIADLVAEGADRTVWL